jgi:septal ring-binding cell division protein DamX
MAEAKPVSEPAPVFFPGGERGKVLEQVEHLALWSHSVTLLTGPAGAGRTTLLSRLVAQLRLRGLANLVFPDVSVLTTPRELLLQLAEALGVDAGAVAGDAGDGGSAPGQAADAGDVPLRRLLVQNAAAERASERPTLIVIDDAHELSSEVLAGLCALIGAAAESRALHVLLAGDHNLRARLDVRVDAHEIRLKPLAYQELRQFARETGLVAEGTLDERDMQAVYRRSGGWPGAIASEWHRELRRRRATRQRVPYALVAGVALTAALLITVLAVSTFRAKSGDAGAAAQAVESLQLPGQPPPAVAAADGEPIARAPVRVDAQPPVARAAPALPAANADPAGAPGAAVVATRAAAPGGAGTASADSPSGTATATAATIPAMAGAAPAAAPGPGSAVRGAGSPAPATTPAAAAAPADDAAAWLRAQPPGNFTLQLVGLSQRAAAERFARERAAQGARLLRTRRGGEDWYLVVAGSYATRAEAQAAASAVAGGGQQPWLRTFDGIQAEVRGSR